MARLILGESEFWYDSIGIVRWGILTRRPGTYRIVIASYAICFFLNWQEADWDHITAVVDDFGNLVKVSDK